MAWSDLPSDILGDIAKRIDHITHFQHFSLVCRSWYECSLENRGHLPLRPPLMMLPYDEGTKTCSLLSINKGLLRLHLPELSGKWCCGASKGWLVLIDEKYDISLLNPFTRVQRQLPQHPSFPHLIPEYSWHGSWKNTFIKKAVLSTSPESLDCVVILIVSNYSMLSFCKLNDGKWRTVRAYSNYEDIIWFGKEKVEEWIPERDYMQFANDNGGWTPGCLYSDFQDIVWLRNKIYAAQGDRHAVICDVNDLSLEEITWPLREYRINSYSTFRYLVESRGELLHVIRYLKRRPQKEAKNLPKVKEDRPYNELFKTQTLSVFRMERNELDTMWWWRKLDSIGDRCLFLGGVNESVCCSVLDFPELRANSIYFAENFFDACFRNVYGCHDVGVFSLATGDVEPLFEAPPFFAHPSFFL